MKSISILLLFIFLFTKFSFSQDTLVMRNNTIVLAKVLEVLPLEVKYLRFEYLDSPFSYSELKSKIKEIKYANGFKETFVQNDELEKEKSHSIYRTPVDYRIKQFGHNYLFQGNQMDEEQLNKLLLESNNKEIITLILKSQKAQKVKNVGFVAIPVMAIGVGGLFASMIGNPDGILVTGACVLVAAPFGITGLIKTHDYRRYRHEAIVIHNLKY